MKLETTTIEVERGNTQRSAAFHMEFNAKMADMLSRAIYSDTVLAVVREYVANAVDAQKMVGSKEPIVVHVPTNLSPHWSVRDFGPGLSQMDVMGDGVNGGLFNTYGRSDKTGTNTLIGGFGLGSKAGFAYIDRGGMFNVTSWHGGLKNTYACHKNEEGIPVVTLMSSVKSDEPTGIEIKVPVKAEDISKFSNRTGEILAYMDAEFMTHPLSFMYHKPEYLVCGTNWKQSKYVGASAVVMGGVRYVLSTSQDYQDVNKIIRNGHIDFYLPIGSVELSVSREQLQYDKRTIDTIVNAARVCNAEYVNNFRAQLQNCNSYKDAVELCRNANRSVFTFDPTKDFNWKGERVYFSVQLANSFYGRDLFQKCVRAKIEAINCTGPITYSRYNRWKTSISFELSNDFSSCIIVNVNKNATIERLSEAFYKKYPIGTQAIFIRATRRQLARVYIALRREPQVIDASSLPLYMKKSTARVAGDMKRVLSYLPADTIWTWNYNSPYQFTRCEEKDLATKARQHFVWTKDKEFFLDKECTVAINLKAYWRAHSDKDLWFIPQRYADLVAKNSMLVNPLKETRDALEKYKDDHDKAYTADQRKYFGNRAEEMYKALISKGLLVPQCNRGLAWIKKQREEIARWAAVYASIREFSGFVFSHWSRETPKENKLLWLDIDQEGLYDTYPILKAINLENASQECIEHLKLYIETVDKQKGKKHAVLSCAA